MLFIEFVSWWYGPGWRDRIVALKDRLAYWGTYFSIGQLITSLFAPWKQITSAHGSERSFDQMMSDMIDNTISRFVGFFVRVFVIIAGICTLLFVFVFSLVVIIVWPALPVLPLVLIAVGAA